MPKRKKKAYIVVDKKHKYMYGAFHFNEDGLKKAEDLIKELENKNEGKFILKTK